MTNAAPTDESPDVSVGDSAGRSAAGASTSASDRAAAEALRSSTGAVSGSAGAGHEPLTWYALFRLGVLISLTGAAGAVSVAAYGLETPTPWSGVVWTGLAVAFAGELAVTRTIARGRGETLAWSLQAALDLGISALAVLGAGGLDSGLGLLYVLGALGAAALAPARVAVPSLLATLALLSLHAAGESSWAAGLTPWEWLAPRSPRAVWADVFRVGFAVIGVWVLGRYLSRTIAARSQQIGSLRALTEHILRALPTGLITTDLDGSIIYANPTAQLWLGDQVRPGAALAELMPLKLGHHQLESRASQTAPTRTLAVSVTALSDAEGDQLGHVVNLVDQTELLSLHARVLRNSRLAAVGEVSASMAHEIRNPLAAILGSTELLAGTASDADARLLRVISREATRLSELVDSLLRLTREREAERTPVDLANAARAAVEAFETAAEFRACSVRLDVAPQVPCVVSNASQLQQVTWNLLRNACEAGAHVVEVRVDSDDAQEHATLTVDDDGPGIDPERLPRIFDPFVTHKPTGTGLGLALVDRVVAAAGGHARVENLLRDDGSRRGARFILTFPSAARRRRTPPPGSLTPPPLHGAPSPSLPR